MRLQYSIISGGSEGGCCTLIQITMLQYSIISDGSEEDEKWEKNPALLQYSIFSHGSESQYAIAPLVLLVRENTIL